MGNRRQLAKQLTEGIRSMAGDVQIARIGGKKRLAAKSGIFVAQDTIVF